MISLWKGIRQKENLAFKHLLLFNFEDFASLFPPKKCKIHRSIGRKSSLFAIPLDFYGQCFATRFWIISTFHRIRIVELFTKNVTKGNFWQPLMAICLVGIKSVICIHQQFKMDYRFTLA